MAKSQALIPYFDTNLGRVEQLREAKKLAQYLYDEEMTLFDVCDKIRQNHPQKQLLLWDKQHNQLISEVVYQAIGRVKQALSRHHMIVSRGSGSLTLQKS
ncbi:MAG: hypothetical protein ACI84K_002137 [Pseudohongiellaceae bacterium]